VSASWTWKLTPVPVEDRNVRSPEWDAHLLWRLSCTDRRGEEWMQSLFVNEADLERLHAVVCSVLGDIANDAVTRP
jgi:hypothetical protein